MTIHAPPTDLMFDGPQDTVIFWNNGQEFLNIYRDLAQLKPDAKMLDVGSGIGRKTIPLTGYLTNQAIYEGIDVNPVGVKWCQDNITSQFPNFRFQHVDVYAPGYYPQGKTAPEDFVFPFADETFDFVTLCSVFTHMQILGVTNYMGEIYRVLKPGGRCLITWFLLHEDALGKDMFPYFHPYGRMAQAAMPEQAIAFDGSEIVETYGEAGLLIKHVEPGNWSGLPGLSYQDIIIAEKG